MKAALAVAVILVLASAGARAATPEDIMTKAGCTACHAKDKKIVGPAFKDIAAKYKGQDVVAKLMAKVRAGGSGNWGPIPMVPNPAGKIGDADLKFVVEYILKS